MKIGLHDADVLNLRNRVKFPNFALMKISAWHKARDDIVERWNALEDYDAVYSSKVFTFTPENKYLPPDTIKGGTGYDIKSRLPPEIEKCRPDYSIYPECDYVIGFVTRGCPNNCPWCCVPEKEGGITPYSEIKDIADGWRNIVLMDNNILASDHGIRELEKCAYSIDINQGLDTRLVDRHIADILARIHWTKYIRFACDRLSAVKPLMRAVKLLNERGVSSSRIFVYFLVRDIAEAMDRVRELRQLGTITLYAQAYRDFKNPEKPVDKEAYYFATKYIYSGQWRKYDWYDTPWGKRFLSDNIDNKNSEVYRL